MSVKVLLVHPERYRQLMDCTLPKVLASFDYVKLDGVEIHQESFVPLTVSVKRLRPWWAFWRPRRRVVEIPVLGWWWHGDDRPCTAALPS